MKTKLEKSAENANFPRIPIKIEVGGGREATSTFLEEGWTISLPKSLSYWVHEVSLASVWRGQSGQSGVIASLVQSGVVANLAGYLPDWTRWWGGARPERHPPEQRLNNRSGHSRTEDQGPRTEVRRQRTKDQGPGPRTLILDLVQPRMSILEELWT